MTTRAAARAALAAAIALSVAPAAAHGHAILRSAGDTITFSSPDETSQSQLTIQAAGAQIAFRDPAVDGGLDWGDCTPGEMSGTGTLGYVIEAFCPAAGVQLVRVELGAREDIAVATLAVATMISGGTGADTITGGNAGDAISGDEGDDALVGGAGGDDMTGGLGADDLRGGTGDDIVRARDGIRDIVGCGEGTDTVDADTLDEVDADCEALTRTATVPLQPAAAPDRVAPQVRADAPARQRIGRSRRVRLFARSSETGFVAASGYVNVDGLRLPISVPRRDVSAPNRRVELSVMLKKSLWRRALRSLRGGHKVSVRLTAVATDRTGNSRRAKAVTIRLLR